MSMPEPVSEQSGMAKVIYILYLVSLIVGITGLIGVVLSYVYRSNQPEWLQSHFQCQIRTFWIGLLYGLLAVITMPILLGYLVYLLLVVWLVIRCGKGLRALAARESYPNPESWLF